MEEIREKSFAQITLYNQLIKEMDDLYRVYAKHCNLSETAFWILYCVREREKEAFTQREICEYWFYTPQTVNSALKNMTEEGLLTLRAEEGNRKNKRIYLTEKGKETVERIVVPLMDAERRALAAIGEQETEVFLQTMKKHTDLFREEVERMTFPIRPDPKRAWTDNSKSNENDKSSKRIKRMNFERK